MISKEPKAWSNNFWISLQRKFNKASVEHGLSEMDYLFRAVLRKKTNKVVIKPGGYAFWHTIKENELKKWVAFMRVWGWYDNKLLTWNEQTEKELLRQSIRAFALHPDGPIPLVLCDGAKKRFNDLKNKLEKYKEKNILVKNNLNGNWDDIYEIMKNWDQSEWDKRSFDIKQIWEILRELKWKEQSSNKIKNWLIKKGTIPLDLTTEWLNVWNKGTKLDA